jgi:hypothetical protein
MGLEVPEEAIDRLVARQEADLADRGVKLEDVLREQGISLGEFRKALAERELVIAFQRSAAGLGARTHAVLRPRHDSFVRPTEIQAYYREHQGDFREAAKARVRTIFLRTADFLKPGMEMFEARILARNSLKEIRARVEAGESFATLARELSRDQFRPEGGDNGFKEKRELPEHLRTWAFRAEPGSLSDLFQTANGCTLALLEERREARIRPFVEVQDEIRRILAGKRRSRSIARAILDLLDESDITPARYAARISRDLREELRGGRESVASR